MWCWYTLYLLILASVLTRMLLDSILLTLWVNYRKEITALSWSVCFLGLLPAHPNPHPPPNSSLQKQYLKDRFSHVKNWTWRTAICSQVAKHTRSSETVGTGPWMKLPLPTDKAETKPENLLKTRWTEYSSCNLYQSDIMMGGAVLYLRFIFKSMLAAELPQLHHSFIFFPLSNHPQFWCRTSMFSKDGWLLPVYLMLQGCTLFFSLIL